MRSLGNTIPSIEPWASSMPRADTLTPTCHLTTCALGSCPQKAVGYFHREPEGGSAGNFGTRPPYAAQFAVESLSLVGEKYDLIFQEGVSICAQASTGTAVGAKVRRYDHLQSQLAADESPVGRGGGGASRLNCLGGLCIMYVERPHPELTERVAKLIPFRHPPGVIHKPRCFGAHSHYRAWA